MRTKIIANIGPASCSPEIIEAMLREGLDMVRFNFAHGNHDEYTEWTNLIRTTARQLGREVKFLQDLSGPRIRVGKQPEEGRTLTVGEKVTLVRLEDQTSDDQITMTGINLLVDVKKGERILLANGAMELIINDVTDKAIEATVTRGGVLMSNKSINVPDTCLTASVLTEKDRADLKYGIEQGYEFIGLSFVQDEKDVAELRGLIGSNPQKVVAKVERQAAVNNIDAIIKASDAIMIARGDLGAEVPVEDVPFIQKEIINKSIYAGKPTITATQMLTSMINNPYPTRAEVSDIANAVLDGTNGVWLSDETAVGKYPVETLKVMRKVVEKAEAFQNMYYPLF